MAVARQIGHHEWLAAGLHNLGSIMRRQGNYEGALPYLQDGLSLLQEIGKPDYVSAASYEIGRVYLAQMRTEQAQEMFRKALAVSPQESRDTQAMAQYGLALVAATQGNKEEARRLGEMSLATLQEIEYRDTREVQEWLTSLRENH
jgi:tetratricopeptide (TPR) repeat protein